MYAQVIYASIYRRNTKGGQGLQDIFRKPRMTLELFVVCSVVVYVTNALVVAMAKMQVISEVAPGELIADPDDFEALAVEHAQQLYNTALRMTGSEEDAKDLCQDALLRAYRSFGRWRRECSFSSWLYRIATNLFIDQARRRKRIRLESLDAPLVTDDGDQLTRAFESGGRDPQALAEAAEVQREVHLALQKLPPEFRMAVVLCDIQGFSYAEISEIMDCSIGTVRSRIHRARRALKNHLEPYVSEAMVDEL